MATAETTELSAPTYWEINDGTAADGADATGTRDSGSLKERVLRLRRSNDDDLDVDERAAIAEFDDGLSRYEAERLAARSRQPVR